MNAEIDREENIDINHRVRHIIQLTKEWIKRPFKLDPVPQIIVFQGISHLVKGRGVKVIVPMFIAQSLIRPKIMYQHNREFRYFKAHKGKNKNKRVSPQ